MREPIRVGVVGCGLIGTRRAREAAKHPRTRLSAIYDVVETAARNVAETIGGRLTLSWRDLVHDPNVDAVIVSTPNAYLCDIGLAALRAGKHVLVEKPMGRNLREAEALAAAAERAGRVLKVGFNHRYHRAIAAAHAKVLEGAIGSPFIVRARYGHGGRPGYEHEWRADSELAGGGELLDQGIHVLDLLTWFLGNPKTVYCVASSALWPIAPLEDNAVVTLTYPRATAVFHASWTQWTNLFSFELFGSKGSLSIEGLGGSYGVERLTEAYRKIEGGPPGVVETTFPDEDDSWFLEWSDFVAEVAGDRRCFAAAQEGVAVMRLVTACYRSAALGEPVSLAP